MGPQIEQVVDVKEKKCSQLNSQASYILTHALSKGLYDVLDAHMDEDDDSHTSHDAHLIWITLKEMYGTGSRQESVKPVGQTGQTSLSRDISPMCNMGACQEPSQASSPPESSSSKNEIKLCLMAKKSKKKAKNGTSQKIELSSSLVKELELLNSDHASLVCKYDSLANDYTCATKSLSCVASLEKANEVLKAQLEKLTSEHMALQATHKELDCSHEKLVESYAILDIAHEVVITLVKSIQPLTHTCSCSQVKINSSCTNLCCSQASQSSIEHVFVESCDDLVAQENDELIQQVERLKKDLSELNGKSQVQPSQDNREDMVKKLDKGSTTTRLATSQNQQQQDSRKGQI
uniref:Uncharacterized protein n=1 Tax=Setaria italica TaxID=4555 RepID=K3Y388_SETIT